VAPSNAKYYETANLLMDRSNEDHCGVCIEESRNKITTNSKTPKHEETDENYYFPFTL